VELLHVGGVDVEGVKLCGIVGVICTYDGGNARDLQALCAARSFVFVVDGKRDVLVLLERTELQPTLGEDDEFACTIFVREWGTTDEVAVRDGKSAGVACLYEVLNGGTEFICRHFYGVLVFFCPKCGCLLVVHGAFSFLPQCCLSCINVRSSARQPASTSR